MVPGINSAHGYYRCADTASTGPYLHSSSSRFNTSITHHVQQHIQHPTHTRTHSPCSAAQQYSCGYDPIQEDDFVMHLIIGMFS